MRILQVGDYVAQICGGPGPDYDEGVVESISNGLATVYFPLTNFEYTGVPVQCDGYRRCWIPKPEEYQVRKDAVTDNLTGWVARNRASGEYEKRKRIQ